MNENLKWGAILGLRMAVIYSLAAVIIAMLARGSGRLVLGMVVAYFAGGFGSGLLLGLFRPIVNRSRTAAMLIGVLIAIPAVSAVGLAVHLLSGPSQYEVTAQEEIYSTIASGVFSALFFGGLGGWYFGPGGPGHSGQ